MGSRIENLIRSAVSTFSPLRPTSSYVNSTSTIIDNNIQYLRQIVSEISPAEDLGLTRTIGQPQRSPINPFSPVAPVTYMEIFENHTVTIGVFILKEGACIPLHDHLGMHGILKVLYGSLKLQSYTPTKLVDGLLENYQSHKISHFAAKKLPPVTLNEGDGPVALTPKDSNIHEIIALEGSASFLDILAPPYDPDGSISGQERDCFYYKDICSVEGASSTDIRMLSRIPCPSSFWCNSVKYSGPDLQHLYHELS